MLRAGRGSTVCVYLFSDDLFYCQDEVSIVVAATDNGLGNRKTEVTVIVELTDDSSTLPPVWAIDDGQQLDDITVEIAEDADPLTILKRSVCGTLKIYCNNNIYIY